MAQSHYKNGDARSRGLNGGDPLKGGSDGEGKSQQEPHGDPNRNSDRGQSDRSLVDLEKRLEHRLAMVNEEVKRGAPGTPGRKTRSLSETLRDRSAEVPRSFEITDALNPSSLGLGDKRGVAEAGKQSPANAPGTGKPTHPPSSDALDWSGVGGGRSEKPVPATPPAPRPGAGHAPPLNSNRGNDAATASLTILPGSEKHTDSHDSMEGGAELPKAPPIPNPTLAGAPALPNRPAIDPHQHQQPIVQPGAHNTGLDLAPDGAPQGALMPLGIDNDPPPLATHLKREESQSDGKRSLVVAGFLGGLSMAFIVAWGYFYTLPRDGGPGAASNGTANRGVALGVLELKVTDVSWTSGRAVPLPISIKGGTPDRGVLVKLEGVPLKARLSRGFPDGDGEWLIPSAELNGLTMTLNDLPAGNVSVRARLLEKDAKTETGNFANFTIYAAGQSGNSLEYAATASTAVPGIPVPRLAEDAGGGNQAASSDVRKTARVPSGNSSDAQGGLADREIEDETFGVLPEDFNESQAGADRLSALARRAAQAKPVAPPARARSARQAAAGGRQASLSGATSPGARSQIAAQENQLAFVRLTDAERALIRSGNQFMKSGDIRQARIAYKKAMARNSPEAALALGRSFDPNYLVRISGANEHADSDRALELYRKALAAGMEAAQIKIDRLVKSMAKR